MRDRCISTPDVISSAAGDSAASSTLDTPPDALFAGPSIKLASNTTSSQACNSATSSSGTYDLMRRWLQTKCNSEDQRPFCKSNSPVDRGGVQKPSKSESQHQIQRLSARKEISEETPRSSLVKIPQPAKLERVWPKARQATSALFLQGLATAGRKHARSSSIFRLTMDVGFRELMLPFLSLVVLAARAVGSEERLVALRTPDGHFVTQLSAGVAWKVFHEYSRRTLLHLRPPAAAFHTSRQVPPGMLVCSQPRAGALRCPRMFGKSRHLLADSCQSRNYARHLFLLSRTRRRGSHEVAELNAHLYNPQSALRL